MTEFLKIHSHGRIIFVRMIRPGAGFRVARSGEDWEQETKVATRKEMVLFSDTDIIQRMRMNLHYAELEEVPGRR